MLQCLSHPLFDLIVNNKATATSPIDLTDCDTSATGAVTSTFDLEQQTATILGTQDPSTFTVTYHSTEEEAASDTNILSSPLTTTSTTIYVRVEEDGLHVMKLLNLILLYIQILRYLNQNRYNM